MSKLDVAKQLYIYSFPLIWARVFASAPKERFQEIAHCRVIAPPGKDSYKPNQDTLYSFLPLQLKNSPYIVEIPKLDDDRFYLVNTVDTKTDIHFSTGSKDVNNGAGKYILLYRDDEVPAGYEDYTVVRNDDSFGTLLVRVETFGEDDYPQAHAIQDKTIVKPVYPDKLEDTGTPPPVGGYANYIKGLSAKEYYSTFYELLEVTKVDNVVFEYSKELGIDPTAFDFDLLPEDTKEALVTGSKEAYYEITHYNNPDINSNNWQVYVDGVASFGDKYLLRAYIAWYAWGANLPEDSIYPVLYVDDKGNTLSTSKKYKVHFSSLPEAKYFWSFIVYGEPSGNLVENELGIYTINSHSLDRYIKNTDGSLDIYLSKAIPDNYKEINFLPLPKDEDEFSIILRLYGASEKVLSGNWEFPLVTEI